MPSCKVGLSVGWMVAQGAHSAHGTTPPTPCPASKHSLYSSETCPCCLSCFASRDRELTTSSLKCSRHWSCLQRIHSLFGEVPGSRLCGTSGHREADSPGPVRGCSQQKGQSSIDRPWRSRPTSGPDPRPGSLVSGDEQPSVSRLLPSACECWDPLVGRSQTLPYPAFPCCSLKREGTLGAPSPLW